MPSTRDTTTCRPDPDFELEERLRSLRWPVAPDPVKRRCLDVVIARIATAPISEFGRGAESGER